MNLNNLTRPLLMSILITLAPLVRANEAQITHALTEELSGNQDSLSADIQELVELQTQNEVIQKLEETEQAMIEATLRLLDGDTGGETLSIQTEIIEKAYEAAQQKQQQSNSKNSSTNQALMDMLNKMLDKGDSQKQGKENTKKKRANGGSSDHGSKTSGEETPATSSNQEAASSISSPTVGSRRAVPSVTPSTGALLPSEFQDFVQDYNKR